MGKLGLGSKSSSSHSLQHADAFTEDPCTACENLCDTHDMIPASMASKIEQGDMTNSVKPYRRHLLLCAGTGQQWPERLEELSKGSYVERIDHAVHSASKKAGYRTILTACDRDPFADDEGDGEGGVAVTAEGTDDLEAVKVTDLLSFPDFVRFPNLTAEDAAKTCEALISGKGAEALKPVPLKGEAYVLVCTHKKRDKRCGVAGPLLMDEFKRVVEEKGLAGKVHCYGVSHIGGHKFAGNIIVYSRKFPNGVWYGRVRTCHAEGIIDGTVVEGKIFKELYRGQGDPLPPSEDGKKAGW
ncbi:hypothetical protein HK101_009464 [Irineochytrium annulatum]|nr:hypothetical protein HK101_009464 [Irineochytrium annulatum]